MKRVVKRIQNRRQAGLILLVVLGMLALFSLLAVTYVVFSGQSRATSMALANAEIRGRKSHKSLMDEAIKALVRGPREITSPMRNHDLLGDVYGVTESSNPKFLQVRIPDQTSRDRPLLFGRRGAGIEPNEGHFLRIPLVFQGSGLPTQSDVLNGRIVTFPDGNGPLSGKSFHIVRYIGLIDTNVYGTNPPQEIVDQRYSITIDLNEANLDTSYTASIASVGSVTGSVWDWVLGNVPVNSTPAFYACYRNPGTAQQTGYQILLNAAPLNSHGLGRLNDGSSQSQIVYNTNGLPTLPSAGNIQSEPVEVSTALQPNHPALLDVDPPETLVNALVSLGLGGRGLSQAIQTGTVSNTRYGSQATGVLGDTDEPYDAPTFDDMWASYRESEASQSFQIIPAFHRPSLINYLVNWQDPTTGRPKDPRQWTAQEFLLTLYRVHLATLRPVSYQVNLPNNVFVGSNPEFTGGNVGSAYSTPNLVLNLSGVNTTAGQPMGANWPTVGWPAFESWLNSLTLGPWDVDNDNDGVNDSVFVDAGLPFETSKEGKLLKALVAYYVDSLDSKLDINAVGSLAQADHPVAYRQNTQYQQPLNDNRFSKNGQAQYLYQGAGYGPAEISFRHIVQNGAQTYRNIIAARYGTNGGMPGIGVAINPGAPFTPYLNPLTDDALSLVHARGNERLVRAVNSSWPNVTNLGNKRIVAQAFRHGTLPGLPMSPTGRASFALDRLGNPLIWTPTFEMVGPNNSILAAPDSWNDPYEGPYQDAPYSIAEWERIYRHNDEDSTTLPTRLQALFGLSNIDLNNNTLRHMITPLSSHNRLPSLAMRSRGPNEPYYGVNGAAIRNGNNIPAAVAPIATGYVAGPNNAPAAIAAGMLPNVYHRFDGRSRGANSFYMLVDSLFRLKFDQQGTPGIPALPNGETHPAWFLKVAPLTQDNNNNPVLTNAFPQNEFVDLFPMEFHRGQPMNLNRHFGNRVDDDNDGNIDEADELAGTQYASEITNSSATTTSQVINNNDPPAVFEDYVQGARRNSLDQLSAPSLGLDNIQVPAAYRGMETRQLYARHLYCLAQLLVPEDFAFANVNQAYYLDLLGRRFDSQADFLEFTRVRGRILAQWAINTVDFRDADSDMTRFPYDPDPFRDNQGNISVGWNTAAFDNTGAVIGTNVVWGLEQSEMMLTESFATHDLRVRIDEGDPNDAMDDTVEQYRKPEGSLFLELFCPRTTGLGNTSGLNTSIPGVSPSLYTSNGNGVALNVGKVVGLPGNRLPVWRVVVSEPKDPAASQALKSPDERIRAQGLTQTSALPHDLMYQFGGPSHGTPDSANPDHSGLIYDYTSLRNGQAAEAISAPNSAESRIICFATEDSYDKSTMPGVDNPDEQVFSNESPGYDAATQLTLNGGQYLVVGPRQLTYFGSRTTAPTGTGGNPANQPNPHYIDLRNNWPQLYIPDATNGARVAVDQRLSMRNSVNMIAAIDTGASGVQGLWGDRRTTNGNRSPDDQFADPQRLIGISVSEPAFAVGSYYEQPDERLNSDDTMADTYDQGNNPQGTDALGFANLADEFGRPYDDAYVDYGPNGNGTPHSVEDTGAIAPLDQRWVPGTKSVGGEQVVSPGTTVDFCTAYLQRLASPDRAHHPIFNPYITVDWIPIDLTVFSGEEDDQQLDPPAAGNPGAIRFATRQKAGQSLNPNTLAYDGAVANAMQRGSTFYSALTTEPPETTPSSQATVYFEQVLGADESMNSNGLLVPANPALRPTPLASTITSTLGFLNATYRLLGDGTDMSTVPAPFVGAPSDPLQSDPDWRPDAMFWANRDFVSSLELMWVPSSSPGQIMQEFSARSSQVSESLYAASFRQDDSGQPGLLKDRRTPAAPVAPGGTNNGTYNVLGNNNGFAFEPTTNSPYPYLLNFFQEVPELQRQDLSPAVDHAGTTVDRNSKSTSLAMLLDLVETPSPWAKASRFVSPRNVSAKGINSNTYRDENNAETIILAPFRAPYNGFPTYSEPGRININMISEPNVLFGLGSNLTNPNDRVNPVNRANLGWQFFDNSRRGYRLPTGYDLTNNPMPVPLNEAFYRSFRSGAVGNGGNAIDLAQGYDPNSFLSTALGLPSLQGYIADNGGMFFNPHFPTRFGSPFRPAMEAGMVPVTRNPFPRPQGTSSQQEREQLRMFQRSNKKGVLDLYARKSAAHATLLRGTAAEPFGDSNANPGSYDPLNGSSATTPISAGVYKTSDKPLYSEPNWEGQRNPLTDYSFVTRLKNLTTERSNVFAVYATIAFFEYDTATQTIGQEYGADTGEAQRYRGFYVIDRSKPVGYETGEDHNVEETILLRRYLKTDD